MDAPNIAAHFETVAQVAARWGNSRVLVMRYINQKRIPGVQFFGDQFFVPRGSAKPAHQLGRPRKTGPTVTVHPEILRKLAECYDLTPAGWQEARR